MRLKEGGNDLAVLIEGLIILRENSPVVVCDGRLVCRDGIGETVYDPGCGTGGFLAQSYEYMKVRAKSAVDLATLKQRTFYGREKDTLIYPIALLNLVLHGIDEPRIWHGNTLSKTPVSEALFQGTPAFFDVVLMNPPFGGKEGKEAQTVEEICRAEKKKHGVTLKALEAWNAKAREAREALAKAETIENAAFDLKAVNPNRVIEVDIRTPADLLAEIEVRGREADAALTHLRSLLVNDDDHGANEKTSHART